jgi:hypothetical protein
VRAHVAGRVACRSWRWPSSRGWPSDCVPATCRTGSRGHRGGRRPPGRHSRGARLEHALDLLRRAGEHNPDPRPQTRRGGCCSCRPAQPRLARLLEAVVEAQLRATSAHGVCWRRATAPFDERRSLQANGELLRLYGHIPGRLGNGVVRSPRRRAVPVAPVTRPASSTVSSASAKTRGVRRLGADSGHASVRERGAHRLSRPGRGRRRPDGAPPDVKLANGSGRSGFRIVVPIAALRTTTESSTPTSSVRAAAPRPCCRSTAHDGRSSDADRPGRRRNGGDSCACSTQPVRLRSPE